MTRGFYALLSIGALQVFAVPASASLFKDIVFDVVLDRVEVYGSPYPYAEFGFVELFGSLSGDVYAFGATEIGSTISGWLKYDVDDAGRETLACQIGTHTCITDVATWDAEFASIRYSEYNYPCCVFDFQITPAGGTARYFTDDAGDVQDEVGYFNFQGSTAEFTITNVRPRVAAVPLPASFTLFGSCLIAVAALASLSRRPGAGQA